MVAGRRRVAPSMRVDRAMGNRTIEQSNNRARLKQNVGYELLEVGWWVWVIADHDRQFPGEARWEMDSGDSAIAIIEGEGADGDQADAQAEGDQIDDEVKIIELHGGIHPQALAIHPGAQLLAGVGSIIQKQPWLLKKPSNPFSGWYFGRGGGEVGGSDAGEIVGKVMGDAEGFGKAPGLSEDTEVLFVGLEGVEDLTGGLVGDAVAEFGTLAQVRVEEAGEVGETNGV